MTTYEDPGWGPAITALLPFAVVSKRVRAATRANALAALRLVFLAFVTAPFLYLFVLQFLAGGGPLNSFVLLYLAAFGLVLIMVELWLTTRPLDISSPGELVSSYRTNFFLKVATSEVPVLLGFILALLGDVMAPYLVGLGFGLVGLAIAAPTRGNIERRQREITAQGSTLSLGRALVSAPGR